MPYKRRMRTENPALHFVLGSLPLIALVAVLPLAFGGEFALAEAMRQHKNAHDLLREIAFFFTDWGNPAFYLTFLGILVHGVRTKNENLTKFALTYAACQLAICLCLVNLTKMALGRPRPLTGETVYHLLTLDPHFHSLPSGHTADATGSALALALWRRNMGLTISLGVLLALMGFTRIYLLQHYPSDVFFGWAYGAVSAWAIFTFGLKKDTPAHE
ncbi:undecaprenyl-diphosphatase [Desulfobaculum xiamenense]|uniref:Undecaprenyl-diphosphatase n=1 Tax=Desulfobaculum xiamenense TaxID=995050 RepID=A0A846QRX4_9BACT|nr:phosphatase PAP2 family protein [Desulfobaculum xiamenense]NJB67419.1 undecaprenyl-diphosphatase [Desulfobaculum xiamenense]